MLVSKRRTKLIAKFQKNVSNKRTRCKKTPFPYAFQCVTRKNKKTKKIKIGERTKWSKWCVNVLVCEGHQRDILHLYCGGSGNDKTISFPPAQKMCYFNPLLSIFFGWHFYLPAYFNLFLNLLSLFIFPNLCFSTFFSSFC